MLPLLFLLALTSADLQCPPGYVKYSDEKCFLFVKAYMMYYGAQKFCTSTGGNLASILNGFENTFVRNLALSTEPWIGLARALPDRQYHWLDGTPVSYTNWLPKDPMNVDNSFAVLDTNGYWRTYSDPNGFIAPSVCSAVPLNFTTGTSTTKAQCDSGWTYFSKTGFCYKTFFNEGWYQAEQVCRSAGAHLTSIHNIEENDFVASIAQTGLAQPIEKQVWIGVIKVNNVWTNVDGTATDFFNWGQGIPDSGNDNCIQLFADPYQGGIIGFETTWNAWDCELNQRAFVCKKQAA